MAVLSPQNLAENLMCERFSNGEWASTSVHVPVEREVTIFVNRQALVTILCTPHKLNFLAVGYLYSEGIISGVGEIAAMRVCDEESEIDIRLNNPDFALPRTRTLTSGCSGGTAFRMEGRRVESHLVVPPQQVLDRMRQFLRGMELYRLSGGVHASALSDAENVLAIAEDIGRHNTLDKIQGECLMKGWQTRDRLLLTTGRVSSEMILKTSRMEAPIVVSRTSPTGRAVLLARDLGITLVGYARGDRLIAYSHPERLGRGT